MTMESLKEIVTMRLMTFGYTVTEKDQLILKFVTGEAAQYVCNFCNFKTCPDDVPSSLQYVTADRAVGAFLQHKKTFEPADLSIDLDMVVKQIQTGDTNTVFSDGSKTTEQRLDELVQYLMNYGKQQMYSHRKVKW